MKKGTITFVVMALCLLAIGTMGIVTPLGAAVLEKNGITREMDSILFTGNEIKDLLGKKIQNIRVFAYKNDMFEPIPFQIDEINKKGKYCYREGNEINKDENLAFDKDDELCFVVRDLGDKVKPQEFIKEASTILEAEFVDPVTNKKGWSYIAYYGGNPPALSSVDYVSMQHTPGKEGGDRVESPWMMWYYPWGRSMPSEIVVTKEGGGSGENMIDRFKFRTYVSFAFDKIKMRFNEDNAYTETDAWIDGPVRVVRKVSVKMKIGLGLKTPGLTCNYHFWPTFCYVPANVTIPVSPKSLVSKLYIEAGFDYKPNAFGMRTYNSNNTDGVLVDGMMSPEETNWNTETDQWRLITGQHGSFMVRTLVKGGTLKELSNIIMTTEYRDDITYTEGEPDDVPGEIGHTFQHLDCTEAKAGTFTTYWDFYFPPQYKHPESLQTVLNIRDNPLKKRVQKVM